MPGADFIQDLAVVMVVAGLVGWAFHRIGLSVVVGYLLAGMVIGPGTPPFSLVTDDARIETLASVGLVFLMFSIGVRLSLRRLRRLGLPLIAATAIGAILVFNGCRLLGLSLNWTGSEALFLAGMLMVSSSAIIGKALQDLGQTHDRVGQTAMGITVLEDVVAVLMLTLLGSLAMGAPAASGGELGLTLGQLGAFIVVVVIAGLLFVPRLLGRISETAGEELQTILVVGVLLTLAVLSVAAGYSLALGAFIVGMVVAETPQRAQVERAFQGMRDIFTAVFFVAIGMLIDLDLLLSVGWAVVALAAFTIVLRTAAVGLALVLTGMATRDALRTGLTLTPIGEFSFIIAQLGVGAALLEPAFYPLAVGVSLLTTLAGPLLIRWSDPIAAAVERLEPKPLKDLVGIYHRWLRQARSFGQGSVLWQLSRKRLVQIGVEALFVSGMLLFSDRLADGVAEWLGEDWLFPHGPRALFWAVLGLVLLAPLVALWRNISAMALITSEGVTKGIPRQAFWRPAVEGSLKTAAGLLIFLWLWSLLPISGYGPWAAGLFLLFLGAGAALLWRKLIFVHSEMEAEIQHLLRGDPQAARLPAWLQDQGQWEINISEAILPDGAACGGLQIGELRLRSRFGTTVVGVERQGFLIANPGPDLALYPRDKILLLGEAERVRAAREFLAQRSTAPSVDPTAFEDVRMETVTVPADSLRVGRTLMELDVSRQTGALIAGVRRLGKDQMTPSGAETLEAGDDLLVLGTPVQVTRFREWLNDSGD
jgi:monovalent cation:H+ antiporter-2, CPA2 family